MTAVVISRTLPQLFCHAAANAMIAATGPPNASAIAPNTVKMTCLCSCHTRANGSNAPDTAALNCAHIADHTGPTASINDLIAVQIALNASPIAPATVATTCRNSSDL